ncbi:McrB family protein [Pseudidiomarina mangrovi]|uniref:McrB family protein n=1 Tax=Pseudidiomarina mangrovi TaxID=2487133 RepID=UPI000FCCBADA|nr:hypothetical protein [Pseudidiomarina mangrovi]
MTYLPISEVVEHRSYLEKRIKKPDTFAGLILFIICAIDRQDSGLYFKADMKMFSEKADNAFYLSESKNSYTEKYWYALLSKEWLQEVRVTFLKGAKVSLKSLIASLFWRISLSEVEDILKKIPKDVIDSLFDYDFNPNIYTESEPINPELLLKYYGGNKSSPTIKFDNTFIKKRAGDLNAAPFAQTLYAANEIKRIVIVFDFDFMAKFGLIEQVSKEHSSQITDDFTRIAKPFLLLAGISGTGKTRFVRKQAEKGDSGKCYELVSVRPDWHEPSDLLGYISRLSGTPQYVVTDVLGFVALAWTKIVDAGLDLSVVSSNGHEQIAVTGKLPSLESLGPQWLCLDEMNLAPVEQYFADYLSVLETREWKWDGDSFTYKSDALLKPGIFKELSPGSLSILKNDLGFSEEYSDLWDFVTTHGLGVPPQLIVAGTVNMDETTHGFSRKVIDRALTFDFGEFYPNVLSEIFEPTTKNKTLSYPIHSQAQREYLPAVDSDGALSIEFIEKINAVLDNTPFKLAYRAMNELLLSVICYQPNNELELRAVWDDFLMCKVLPRIEGDTDKLAGNGAQKRPLLDELEDLLSSEFNEFWNASGADEFARPDLLRVNNDSNAPVIRIGCRSRKKLEWMQSRLTTSGFTSFWP